MPKLYKKPRYSVRQNTNTNQSGLFAEIDFNVGDAIEFFSSRNILDTPSYLTVQIDTNQHILLLPIELQYVNHSCNPNCFFNTSSMCLEALQQINTGEELTFFYPSTEWDMDQSFRCNCNHVECLQEIKGAKYLLESEFKAHRFSDYIIKRYTTYYASHLDRD